eukprot:TRINITY_DN3891_c0_g1_i1.p1 TRINITY_DN3891_c0_g1~~TRINITY_DN3891_c0_g1_i1.p1  ORF type:complete len:215 (-),score=12.48 TRINITY_DN3891_c0_g1_i1:303-908(-)
MGSSHSLVLNSLDQSLECDTEQQSLVQIGYTLHKTILKLYTKYLSNDGKTVDYLGLKEDPNFSEYVKETAKLQTAKIQSLTRNERLALFINLYNSLQIHALIINGEPKTWSERGKIWNKNYYVISGRSYSLNDIEHGILRANRRQPFSVLPRFLWGDPRKQLSLHNSEFDPRVHFALVCGAKSCPAVRIYRPGPFIQFESC